jgi:exonuclease SbcC
VTPKRLRLKGFKGIRSGFGRDEIALDFESLAGDAQQIAIIGPNGKGKSTILDNMHPYRLMPSRCSKYSPEAFSYWDHLQGPEGLKELEWEHKDTLYRSTLVFKNGGRTKKAEAYLHVFQDGQWRPASLTDGAVSDGKAESYDRVLEGVLGKPETFFTSAFAAQQRKPLSSYTDGEIKTLLADLLGLEKLREIGVKAAQVTKLLTAGLETMRSALAKVAEAEGRLPGVKAEIQGLEGQVTRQAEQRRQAQAGVAQAQANLAAAKAAAATAADADKRRQELTGRLAAVQKAASEKLAQIDADIRREEGRVAQAEAERNRLDREAQARIASLEDLAAKRRAIAARKDEIVAAAAEAQTLASQERELTEKVAGLRKTEAEANALRTERAKLAGGLQGIAEQGKAQSAICDGLKKRAGLAAEVPCNGSAIQATCPLLKDALEAKDSLGAQERQVVVLRQRYAASAKQVADLDNRLAAYGDLGKTIAAAEQQLQEVRRRLQERQQIAALSAQLADAEEAIQSFEKQVRELRDQIGMRSEAHARLVQESGQAIGVLKQRRTAVEEETRQAQAQVSADLASLPPAFDQSKLGAAELAFEKAEKNLAGIELLIEQTRTALAGVKAKLETTEAEIAEGKAAKDKAGRIEDEIAKWNLLAKAFSNNGIVALSIDDAGPALTGIVNDLLLACYGSRFTVSIKTQVETAKGDLREGFDILVHDAERDESKSVSDMSGGERVWINEALTRGIALYLSRESGNGYDTLFSDEADGPLDPERKVQFMRMKREVLRLGGYQREFFVSQTPELWAMADARIDLTSL